VELVLNNLVDEFFDPSPRKNSLFFSKDLSIFSKEFEEKISTKDPKISDALCALSGKLLFPVVVENTIKEGTASKPEQVFSGKIPETTRRRLTSKSLLFLASTLVPWVPT
jgi:hypothetical protein